jgi:phage tail sheath protein FI
MFVNSLSPGVWTREFDLSTVVPGVATTEAGIAGQFNWGPINERVMISSEQELLDTFGKPDNDVANDWFSCANFLAYANKLWIVRVADETSANTTSRATNATAGASGFLVRNDDEYNASYSNGQLQASFATGPWVAKYAGEIGNSLKISVCPSAAAYQSNLTGTVSTTINSNVVTGVGTNFNTQLTVGDLIIVNNETQKVDTIANATSLTTVSNFVTASTGVSAVRRWEYYNSVDIAPGTSTVAANMGGGNDEMHIVVVDAGGLFTGRKGEILEVYQQISMAADGKYPDGSTSYYKEVINQRSDYVRWAGHSNAIVGAGGSVSTVFTGNIQPVNVTLTNGSNGNNIGADEKIRGYSYFDSPEESDVSIIIGSDVTQTVATYIINNICEKRADCIAFFSPPKEYCVNNKGDEAVDIINYRNTLPSTSYASLDNNWKWQYDRYNDIFRFVPMNADIAGVHVKTDMDRDPWWAAAGFNRGNIKNVVKLAWNPKVDDRDILYKNSVNNVATFAGDGTVLFGQKTLLAKPSAFDRINVRRLFIVLEKAIAKAAKYQLFEFNDDFTRAQFRNMVEPYLRDVQGRRGIYNFKVICDGSNNTSEVIDRNEFVADIYIQPARAIEFIRLNFIATRTGVNFDEIAGKFG